MGDVAIYIVDCFAALAMTGFVIVGLDPMI